jgi:Bacterial membrane protein YfhO
LSALLQEESRQTRGQERQELVSADLRTVPPTAEVLRQCAFVAAAFLLIEAVYAITVGEIEYQGAVLVQGIPFKGLLMDQWREGMVPLWSSLLGAGQPLLADGASVPLDPRHLLFLPFSDVNGYIAAEVFTRALSGSVAFAYLRGRLGASAWPSFLGALLFLSSTVWFEEGTAFTTGALLLPGFAWLSELLYERVTVTRMIALSGAWGAFMLTNSPAYAPFLALACAVWCPLLVGFRVRALDLHRLVRFGVAYTGAVAIGLALAAVMVLPMLELGARSNRGGEYLSEPWALDSLLSAFVGANPPSAVYPLTYFFYVGVVSFGPIAVALRRFTDPYVAAAAAFGLGGAVLTLIWFVTKPALVDVVSATASMSLTRLTFVIGFAAAILVAIGLDRRSWDMAPASRRTLQALFLIQASILIAAAVVGSVLLTVRFADETAYSSLIGRVDQLWPGIVTLVLVGIRALGLGSAVAQPSGRSMLQVGRLRIARVALVGALLAAELILAWGVARPRTGVPYRPTSELSFLQRHTDLDLRAMEVLPRPEWNTPSLTGARDSFALAQNAPAIHGIPVANVYSSLITRDYSDTFDAFGDTDFRREVYELAPNAYMITSRYDSPLIRALGVGYLYSYKELPSPTLTRQVHAGDGYYIYAVRNPLPRAFFAGRGRWLPRDDAYAELRAVAAGDPGRVRLGPEVLLEGTPRTEGTPAYAPARVVSDSGSEVEVAVTAPRAGFLVLSDVFYPGWTATVDGSEAQIEKANGFARAVRVPPGEHSVVFEYSPRSFEAGLGISLVSATACLGLLGFACIRRRRAGAPPGDS